MARRRYIYVEGRGLVEVPTDYAPRPRRAPAVHGVKAPFKSMADGRWYDDARTYEREVRARGFEIVGNSFDRKHWGERPAMPPVEPDIIRAAEELGVSW